MVSRKNEEERTKVTTSHGIPKQGKGGTTASTKPSRTIRSKGATLTFNVTVPDNTNGLQRGVFLSGSFHQLSPNLPDWDPRGLPMRKIDDRHWSITLMSQELTSGSMLIEYQYTLGDKKHVEQNGAHERIPRRRILIESPTVEVIDIDDVVESWEED